MKHIVMLDTTVGSMNIGDTIIYRGISTALKDLCIGNHVRYFPTRTIAFPWYQLRADSRAEWVRDADYKFVCGTNLLHTCMVHLVNQWNINILNCSPVRDSILVGVGSQRGRVYLDPYTRMLYRRILSRDYVHSVRDEATKLIVEDLGVKAINTGCPTLWGLSSDLCRSIPRGKSSKAVLTLHYGRKDPDRDQILVDTVIENYTQVYFFPQTPFDVDYLKSFRGSERVAVLPSNLDAYTQVLLDNNIDYVGVRLHGGIHAMQHRKRSIFILVDKRTRDISQHNHLPSVDRQEIGDLRKMIESEFDTEVQVDRHAIDSWLKQFVQ